MMSLCTATLNQLEEDNFSHFSHVVIELTGKLLT